MHVQTNQSFPLRLSPEDLGELSVSMCIHGQVVKLWSALGEQLGVIRATTSLLDSRRPGPVNTLAFHPHQLSLASGGGDSIVNLYSIKTGTIPDRANSVPVR